MPRATDEWIGKTPDTPIPPRVQARVFERHGGRCHWTGRKIMAGEAWDVDHVVALINGGENRESNLAPILRGKPHQEKTAEDVAIKKKIAKIRARHLGIKQPKKPFPGGKQSKWKRTMDGQVVPRGGLMRPIHNPEHELGSD